METLDEHLALSMHSTKASFLLNFMGRHLHQTVRIIWNSEVTRRHKGDRVRCKSSTDGKFLSLLSSLASSRQGAHEGGLPDLMMDSPWYSFLSSL